MEESNMLQTTESAEVARFDYSSVDQDTAVFLKDKTKRILDLRMKSVLAIGKELSEAQQKLASHNKYEGVFIKWTTSMGFKKSTAYDYIRAHDYVIRNSDNISDPESIQQSLLFAISKPSAPEDLQEKVLSGDITTHKEYQTLLKEKEAAEAKADEAEKSKKVAESKLNNTEVQKKNLEEQNRKLSDDKKSLEKKLADAKAAGNKEQIDTLTKAMKALDDRVAELKIQNESLQKQLKEKPIEVPAVREVIPDEVKDLIYKKVLSAIEAVRFLTEREKEIFVEGVSDDDNRFILCSVNEAIQNLNGIETALAEADTND